MITASKIGRSFQTGLTNVITNRIFQVVFFIALLLGLVYWWGRRSATFKTKQDLVNLPKNNDTINTITQEQLQQIVRDCREYFYNLSLLPGTTIIKIGIVKRMLSLTDYELKLVNNTYNLRYVKTTDDDNLYEEIADDWWGTEGEWRDKILNRLSAIGAGKSTTI